MGQGADDVKGRKGVQEQTLFPAAACSLAATRLVSRPTPFHPTSVPPQPTSNTAVEVLTMGTLMAQANAGSAH